MPILDPTIRPFVLLIPTYRPSDFSLQLLSWQSIRRERYFPLFTFPVRLTIVFSTLFFLSRFDALILPCFFSNSSTITNAEKSIPPFPEFHFFLFLFLFPGLWISFPSALINNQLFFSALFLCYGYQICLSNVRIDFPPPILFSTMVILCPQVTYCEMDSLKSLSSLRNLSPSLPPLLFPQSCLSSLPPFYFFFLIPPPLYLDLRHRRAF